MPDYTDLYPQPEPCEQALEDWDDATTTLAKLVQRWGSEAILGAVMAMQDADVAVWDEGDIF